MKKLIIIALLTLAVFACIDDKGSDPCNYPSLQGETFVFDKFYVMYVDEECDNNSDCPRHLDNTRFYLSIEVTLDAWNKYERGEVIPAEMLVDANLVPFMPADEQMFIIPGIPIETKE